MLLETLRLGVAGEFLPRLSCGCSVHAQAATVGLEGAVAPPMGHWSSSSEGSGSAGLMSTNLLSRPGPRP